MIGDTMIGGHNGKGHNDWGLDYPFDQKYCIT